MKLNRVMMLFSCAFLASVTNAAEFKQQNSVPQNTINQASQNVGNSGSSPVAMQHTEKDAPVAVVEAKVLGNSQEALLQQKAIPATTVAREMRQVSALTRANAFQAEKENQAKQAKANNVVFQTGHFKIKAKTNTISDLRQMATQVAMMQARVGVAKTLLSEIDVTLSSSLKPEREKTPFDKQMDALRAELEELLVEYQLALDEKGAAKASEVTGWGLEKISMVGVEALVKKLDLAKEISQINEEQQRKLNEITSKIKSLDSQIKQVKAHIEKLKGQLLRDTKLQSRLVSNMLLSGLVTVNSYESLVDGYYEVAVVSMWSPKLEEFFNSVLGKTKKVVKFGKTPFSYASLKNDTPWEKVAGTRWMIDNEGVPYLFSVGQVAIQSNNPSVEARAFVSAEEYARSGMALAILSQNQVDQGQAVQVQELQDEDTQVAKNLYQNMLSKTKDLHLQGIKSTQLLREDPFVPGRKMAVVLLELSPTSNRFAQELFDRQRNAVINAERNQQELKGYVAETREQINAARSDTEAYERGRNTARENLGNTQNANKANPSNGRMQNRSFGDVGAEAFQF